MPSYNEIQNALKAPIPSEYLSTRNQGGQTLSYVTWYHATKLADERAPGWSGRVSSVTAVGNNVAVVYAITIPCDEGVVVREATGFEPMDSKGYGDPLSNAESMAFRRALAKHGLALDLYERDKSTAYAATASSGVSSPAPTGQRVGNWNGLLWFGSVKGKHFSDPSVDIGALNWGANNARNKDGSPNEEQRAALRAEIERRQGGAPAASAPASTPAMANDTEKVSPDDLKTLVTEAKANGKSWADVRTYCQQTFGKAEPTLLSRAELSLLRHDLFEMVTF